jgi:hyaluronan synthase
MRTVSTTTTFPWAPGKWRTKEEERLQTLDLVLKILVPALLFICFVVALKYGSFNGYLNLLSRKGWASPLLALGAGFTFCLLGFQVVRTFLWWRYKPYPLPKGPLPSVTVIIPAYNEGAMVEKALYSRTGAKRKDSMPALPKAGGKFSSPWIRTPSSVRTP